MLKTEERFSRKFYQIAKELDGLLESIQHSIKDFKHDLVQNNIESQFIDIDIIFENSKNIKNLYFSWIVRELPNYHEADDKCIQSLVKLRHDMRSHINVMQGYAEMIYEELETLEGAKNISLKFKMRQIIEQINQILLLVNDLNLIQKSNFNDFIFLDNAETVHEISDVLIGKGEFAISKEQFYEELTVLVADDDKDNRNLLIKYLEKETIKNIDTAIDGLDAFNKIQQKNYDLLLLDVMMPRMNGIELLSKIKNNMIETGMKVIVISGADAFENVVQCINLGADDYLIKPYNPQLLRVRIRSSLEKKWYFNLASLYLERLQIEKERYERLLHAIFPAGIVNELAENNHIKPQNFNHVAVVFIDIVNFTAYCDLHSPQEVLHNLQELIEMCEEVSLKHRLDKIKTIGDCFLATSGMFNREDNPVLNCIAAAIEMIEKSAQLTAKWQLRIGVDYGNVIAGIVGRRQYLYDIWGNIVNTAARIQALAEPNTVYLSRSAADTIRKECILESMGMQEIKGRQPMEIFKYIRRSNDLT